MTQKLFQCETAQKCLKVTCNTKEEKKITIPHAYVTHVLLSHAAKPKGSLSKPCPCPSCTTAACLQQEVAADNVKPYILKHIPKASMDHNLQVSRATATLPTLQNTNVMLDYSPNTCWGLAGLACLCSWVDFYNRQQTLTKTFLSFVHQANRCSDCNVSQSNQAIMTNKQGLYSAHVTFKC